LSIDVGHHFLEAVPPHTILYEDTKKLESVPMEISAPLIVIFCQGIWFLGIKSPHQMVYGS